jgi:DNA-binding transcriptional LysR family regulator
MNLASLETFIEVVKSKSLSKAGRKLFISQPAVSFQLQNLEKELGYRLIDRDKNSFAVTKEGKRFFRFAEYVYHEHKHLLFDLNQMAQGTTGVLNIISTPMMGEFLLPSLLNEFREEKPSIGIKMEVLSDSYQILHELILGRSLIGFCVVKPESNDLEVIKIGEDEQVLIVYPGHPFSMLKQVTISDLMGESLILRALPAGREQTYWESLAKAGLDINLYQPKLILGTATGVLSAVEAKSGIALISNLAIKDSVSMGLVKEVNIKNFKLKRENFCIYNKELLKDPIYKNFIDFIRAYYKIK